MEDHTGLFPQGDHGSDGRFQGRHRGDCAKDR
jgi:hypothetical protein